jgi:hypothetical protein
MFPIFLGSKTQRPVKENEFGVIIDKAIGHYQKFVDLWKDAAPYVIRSLRMPERGWLG